MLIDADGFNVLVELSLGSDQAAQERIWIRLAEERIKPLARVQPLAGDLVE